MLSNFWIVGWFIYVELYGLCSIYTALVSFFTALFFGDWMTAQTDADAMCYNFLTPYYWASTIVGRFSIQGCSSTGSDGFKLD